MPRSKSKIPEPRRWVITLERDGKLGLIFSLCRVPERLEIVVGEKISKNVPHELGPFVGDLVVHEFNKDECWLLDLIETSGHLPGGGIWETFYSFFQKTAGAASLCTAEQIARKKKGVKATIARRH